MAFKMSNNEYRTKRTERWISPCVCVRVCERLSFSRVCMALQSHDILALTKQLLRDFSFLCTTIGSQILDRRGWFLIECQCFIMMGLMGSTMGSNVVTMNCA